MKTTEIHADHVYKGPTGGTLKALLVFGRGRNRQLKYRDHTQTTRYATLADFAAWAAEDVTASKQPRTALVAKGGAS